MPFEVNVAPIDKSINFYLNRLLQITLTLAHSDRPKNVQNSLPTLEEHRLPIQGSPCSLYFVFPDAPNIDRDLLAKD